MSNYQKQLIKIREQVDFIGYEFLTWMFLLLEREDLSKKEAIINRIPQKQRVEVLLANRIVSCLINHKEQKTSVSSPLIEDSHEIFASIKNGHLVELLALTFGLGEITVHATIHANDFALTQVKVKNNFEASDFFSEEDGNHLSENEQNREDLFLRMSALDSVEQIVHLFWQKFLDLRLVQSDYAKELSEMKKQVNDKLKEHLREHNTETVIASATVHGIAPEA